MEISQELKQKNVYGKDIYQGLIMYTHKKNSRGYVIPMLTIYGKSGQVLIQAFTYLDYTKATLMKGAFAQFYLYLPHVVNYHHHKIELYLADASAVKNYETVVATQALFAKEVAGKRRTKNTATPEDLELLNKHRRYLNPPLSFNHPVAASVSPKDKDRKSKSSAGEIDWNSPFVYGYKWGGFDKKSNFLKY